MPHRILVVDDDPDVLGSFQRRLELLGYVVGTAATGTDALKLCEENSFDLVILDFIMPNMNGIELLVRVRKLQPHIRSIIISGQLKAEVDEKQLGKELGEWVEADSYLHKPVSPQRLAEEIEALVSRTTGEKDWQALAKDAVKARTVKLSTAKTATKNLGAYKKSKT